MNKDAQDALIREWESMMPDDPSELEEMFKADRCIEYVKFGVA